MIETVLFDLDGTLLPMDQDEFVNAYMELLAKKMAPQGYDPKHLIAAVWAGTKAMVENDGQKTNEEVFWEDFCHIFGPDARKDEPLFEEFYDEIECDDLFPGNDPRERVMIFWLPDYGEF